MSTEAQKFVLENLAKFAKTKKAKQEAEIEEDGILETAGNRDKSIIVVDTTFDDAKERRLSIFIPISELEDTVFAGAATKSVFKIMEAFGMILTSKSSRKNNQAVPFDTAFIDHGDAFNFLESQTHEPLRFEVNEKLMPVDIRIRKERVEEFVEFVNKIREEVENGTDFIKVIGNNRRTQPSERKPQQIGEPSETVLFPLEEVSKKLRGGEKLSFLINPDVTPRNSDEAREGLTGFFKTLSELKDMRFAANAFDEEGMPVGDIRDTFLGGRIEVTISTRSDVSDATLQTITNELNSLSEQRYCAIVPEGLEKSAEDLAPAPIQGPEYHEPPAEHVTPTGAGIPDASLARRHQTTENLVALGIKEKNAKAMCLILEKQEEEFEKIAEGKKGKPLPLSGPKGLMMKLVKASAVSPNKFLKLEGGLSPSATKDIKEKNDYLLLPESMIRFIVSTGLNAFGLTLLRTNKVEVRSVSQIVKDSCNSQDRHYGKMLKDLRSTHCHDGEKILTWEEAIVENPSKIRAYSASLIGKDLGLCQPAVSSIERSNIRISKERSGADLRERLHKPKEIFAMDDETRRKYDKVLSSSISRQRSHIKDNIDDLCKQVVSTEGYKSLDKLLLAIIDAVAKIDTTEDVKERIMTWKMAEKEGLVPFEVALPDMARNLNIPFHTFSQWVRPQAQFPGEDSIQKLATGLSFLSGEENKDRAIEKMAAIFSEFKGETKKFRNGELKPSPRARGKGKTKAKPAKNPPEKTEER